MDFGSHRVLVPNTPAPQVLRVRFACQLRDGMNQRRAGNRNSQLRPPISGKEAPEEGPRALSGLSGPSSLRNWSLQGLGAHPCPSLENQAGWHWGPGSDLHSQEQLNELLAQQEREEGENRHRYPHAPHVCTCHMCTRTYKRTHLPCAHTSHVHTLRLSSFFSRLAHHESRLSPRNLAPEKPDSPPCCSPSSFGTQR